MLAMIGKGHYYASYDSESIETGIQRWFSKAASFILTNIVIDGLDDLEVYPSTILDLCSERPLIVSGRHKGNFPEKLTVKGINADMSHFSIDIEVQHTNDIPLEKVLAKTQIESYTIQAWFSQYRDLEKKVAKMSLETGTVSEYTHMTLWKTEPLDKPSKSGKKQGKKEGSFQNIEALKTEMIKVLHHLGLGFGNVVATSENIPPGFEHRTPNQTEKLVRVAGDCCANVFGKCCCMCCIEACSKMNNQCSVVLTQLCGAVTCLGCFECWD
ncbi:uncharacterized protein LOC143549846 [Bidens hawaiensis]|uniref:uncharacterized protein LOC143549846 n=1 Tax=Bidens hawaiensis TaxID=980011 RepID=UPI00404947AC